MQNVSVGCLNKLQSAVSGHPATQTCWPLFQSHTCSSESQTHIKETSLAVGLGAGPRSCHVHYQSRDALQFCSKLCTPSKALLELCFHQQQGNTSPASALAWFVPCLFVRQRWCLCLQAIYDLLSTACQRQLRYLHLSKCYLLLPCYKTKVIWTENTSVPNESREEFCLAGCWSSTGAMGVGKGAEAGS